MYVRIVHGRCTTRTLAMYHSYIAIVRNENHNFQFTIHNSQFSILNFQGLVDI